VPTPAGHADPAERRRTNFTYGPSPGRAFARLVVNRADELGDTPSANRALYVIPTAARHGRAAEAHRFVRPGGGILTELVDEGLCGFVGGVIKA
jgi:hypothetical protein